MRRDHATVAAHRILQVIAQHITNNTSLQTHIANLLRDEFIHVVLQTMDDLSTTNDEDQT